MRKLDLAAVFIIALGLAFIIAGFLGANQAGVSGGLIFFIGPVPIFIGEGTPTSLILILVLVMAVLSLLGFFMYRRQVREGTNS